LWMTEISGEIAERERRLERQLRALHVDPYYDSHVMAAAPLLSPQDVLRMAGGAMSAEERRNCPECGAAVATDAASCPWCGAPLPDPEDRP